MKQLAILLLSVLIMPTFVNATVWRVNNNPAYIQGCAQCFPSINAATAVGSGVAYFDTLHIEPSGIAYANDTIDKPLVLIGPGFKLGQGANNNDGLQASSGVATISGLRITGFAGTGTGTVIEGCRFTSLVVLSNVGNITLRRNLFEIGGALSIQPFTSSIDGLYIEQNYFVNGLYNSGYDHGIETVGFNAVTNVVINNNYFANSVDLTSAYVGCIVSNNVFDASGPVPYLFHSASVKNNIIAQAAMVFPLATNVHNNIAAGSSTLPVGNGNQFPIDMSTVFVGIGSDDGKWQLQPGMWMTYADDGGQMGMFGGDTPYVLSGIPPIPTIYGLTVPATGIQGEPVNVSLSTKSNN